MSEINNISETLLPLVILDVQDAIDQPIWEEKNNPSYIVSIQKLLNHWRFKGWPVIHIKHNEPTPTSTYHTHGPWNSIKSEVAPIADELVIGKQENCAFIDTDLDKTLKDLGADSFILTGVVIHNSMDATIRIGKALGYKVILPIDATTAVPVMGYDQKHWDAEDVYNLTLAILDGEYAQMTTTEKLIGKIAHVRS